MKSSTSSCPVGLLPAPTAEHERLFASAYALCVRKARHNIVRLADEPKSGAFSVTGDYFSHPEEFFAIGNWTSSFFTGMALLAHATSGDPELLLQCERLAEPYRQKACVQSGDTMHDLGFLYTLYSVGMHRATGSAAHREVGLRAAEELAKRYSAVGAHLRAWGRMDEEPPVWAGLAIIDSMMNLPLLCWASRQTRSTFFQEIAIRHADTTAATFVREDASVFHAFRFDPHTGIPRHGENYCGYAVDSHWARGTAWAIYGFALLHRNTGHARFLATARQVARRFVALLDDEVVPVWDFKLDAGRPRLRDSSAAAIAACGLMEIARQSPADADLVQVADGLLARLCAPDYLDDRDDCPGILMQGEVTDSVIPGTQKLNAKNGYTNWGDYFFMEALATRRQAVTTLW